jgi:glycosyltransferase involved in cell wall biosynthesis
MRNSRKLPFARPARSGAKGVRVLVAICTRQRPAMLARALDFVSRLNRPDGLVVELLVLENGPETRARAAVAAFTAFPAHHAHQPVEGLVAARNAVLDWAAAHGFDWIAMTDDDCQPDPGWLDAYARAIDDYPEAGAFTGPRILFFAAPPSPLAPDPNGSAKATGRSQNFAVTANVMFSRDLFAPDGMGLRFDERFSASGNEDSDFFLGFTRAGGSLVWIADAIVREPIPPHRARPGTMIWRHAQRERTMFRVFAKHDGRVSASLRSLRRALANLPPCLAHALSAIARLPAGRIAAQQHAGRALAHGASVIGALTAPFAGLPRLYDRPDGG